MEKRKKRFGKAPLLFNSRLKRHRSKMSKRRDVQTPRCLGDINNTNRSLHTHNALVPKTKRLESQMLGTKCFEMKIPCQRNGPLKMFRDRTSRTNTYESETHCDRSIQRPKNPGTETFTGQRVTEPICPETTRIIRETDYSPASAIFNVKCTIVTFLHNHVNN